jgi:hypothetical protein
MPTSDWIPTKEQDVVDLVETWKTVLGDTAKVVAFGWNQVEVTEVLSKITGFTDARAAFKADNSSAKRIVKDEAKEMVVDTLRDFANSDVRFNKNMSDADKLQLGVRLRDGTPTHHQPPTSQPDTVVENSGNHFEHRVRAVHHSTGNANKPADVYGVRYAWQVGGEKPATGADLPKTQFSRRTVMVITHTEADKAKTVYYATCYENGKGDMGPWSPIEEAVIG